MVLKSKSLNWHQYFMRIANEVATKSKDPSSQVGCVITDNRHRPISFGYNGWVQNCDESYMTFERPLKYFLICHAEMNAIIFAQRNLKDCILYCTHAPCEVCLRYILQSQIKEIYYENSDPLILRGSSDQKKAVIQLLKASNVVATNLLTLEDYLDEVIRSDGASQT